MRDTLDEILLTPEGAAKIKAELEDLTGDKRLALAKRLREAIQMGDLSENADYIAAKEEQAFLEGKIQELQGILRRAKIVVNADVPTGVIGLGSRVTFIEEGQDPEAFTIVGAKEASPRQGKISNESPIGKALMGRRAGETVEAATPGGGTLKLRIEKVE